MAIPSSDPRRLDRPLAPAGEVLYAHTPNADGCWHSWADHSLSVAQQAARFALPFGGDALCFMAGLLHDAGKVTADVQAALRRCASAPGERLGVPHKFDGAGLASRILPLLSQAPFTLMVLGHHSGIPDLDGAGTPLSANELFQAAIGQESALSALAGRLTTELGLDVEALGKDACVPEWLTTSPDQHDWELFTRMCHSALVDADFLDTAAHFNGTGEAWSNPAVGMAEILQRFHHGYDQHFSSKARTEVVALRQRVFDAAVSCGQAHSEAGIFRMAAPTGSGKTLASMAFALEHAVAAGRKRVIVAVPFTSITTQNAQVLREVLGDGGCDLVLEHHSAIVDGSQQDNWWRRLGAQNWDAEVIVTTTVQLFESLFSNRPSATRKLHRIANSVVVVDEVQALPLLLVPAILRMMRELVEHYNVSFVLASATQPSFWRLDVWNGLDAVDIVPPDLAASAARVRFSFELSAVGWDEVAAKLASEKQALAIVNTTKDARVLTEALREEAEREVVHLSTRMCGAHRASVLARIKAALSEGAPLSVVSTQLIEAGVDVDFPVVYRALAPADSILQAAGRCNREGRLAELGRTVVFRPAEGGSPGPLYDSAVQLTRSLVERDPSAFGTPAFMTRYYNELFETHLAGKRQGLPYVDVERAREKFAFHRVASTFRMIDDAMASVVVTAYGSAEEREEVRRHIDDLRADPGSANSRRARRLLARYSAQIPTSWLSRSELVSPITGDLYEWLGVYADVTGVVDAGGVTIW